MKAELNPIVELIPYGLGIIWDCQGFNAMCLNMTIWVYASSMLKRKVSLKMVIHSTFPWEPLFRLALQMFTKIQCFCQMCMPISTSTHYKDSTKD